MTTTTTNVESSTAQPKTIRRYITRREAVDAANRLRTAPDGTRYVVRFGTRQRAEHLVLVIAFTMLAVTGLSQTYYDTRLGGLLLALFGGIDGARQIHHLFAVVFGLQSIYHVNIFLHELFVFRRISKIWPAWSDVRQLVEMLRLNLGLSKEHPHFDRYTFEEKAEYWALVWGTVIMGLSGIMQWFPAMVTQYLPGWAIPAARSLHRWEAILAVLAIGIWHPYHVLIKTVNKSMFTGTMTVEEMQAEHPLELQYLEQAAAAVRNNRWPVLIELATVPHAAEHEASAEAHVPVKPASRPKKKPAARAESEGSG